MELMVVLMLVVLVTATAYTVYTTALSTYRVTAEQVDAQSQFRLIVGILESEVGTATEVELMNLDEIPETLPAGFACIYAKTDGEYGKFYKKTLDDEVEFVTPYPLKSLTMRFRQGTSDNVLNIFLHAKDTNDYSGSILTQNDSLIYINLDTEYDAVYYKMIDEASL